MKKFIGALCLLGMSALIGCLYYFGLPFLAVFTQETLLGISGWFIALVIVVQLLVSAGAAALVGVISAPFDLNSNIILAIVCALLILVPSFSVVTVDFATEGWHHIFGGPLMFIGFSGALTAVLVFLLLGLAGRD